MNQEELTQMIERIGLKIWSAFKQENIQLSQEELDELEIRVLNILANHGLAK